MVKSLPKKRQIKMGLHTLKKTTRGRAMTSIPFPTERKSKGGVESAFLGKMLKHIHVKAPEQTEADSKSWLRQRNLKCKRTTEKRA